MEKSLGYDDGEYTATLSIQRSSGYLNKNNRIRGGNLKRKIFEIEIIEEDIPEGLDESLRDLVSKAISEKLGLEEDVSYHVEEISI